MNENSWLNNPALKDMEPLKIQVMSQLAQETAGKSLTQAIPSLLKAQQTLKNAGLSFSASESALLMELLTKDMSPAEKQQIEKMKMLINQNIK